MDYSFRLFPGIPDLGTTGKRASSSLSIARRCVSGITCVIKVQRGLDRSVPQLLLRDLGGYADVVQDRSMYVTQLMSRHAIKPCGLCRRPQHYSRGAVRPIGSGRVSLPRSIWRRTSCDAHPRVRVSVDR